MRAAHPFELKGWHVLSAMLAFFGVTIAVNALFITMAVKTFPGEVVPRSYVQGLRYNEVLADREQQARLGWRAEAEFAPSPTGAALVVTLRDRDGEALEGLALTGALRRPATDDADVTLIFERLDEGRYVADVAGLEPGRWDMRVLAARGQEHLEIGGALTWTP